MSTLAQVTKWRDARGGTWLRGPEVLKLHRGSQNAICRFSNSGVSDSPSPLWGLLEGFQGFQRGLESNEVWEKKMGLLRGV